MDSRSTSDLSDVERIKEINGRVGEMTALYLKWAKSAKFRYRSLSLATIGFSTAVPVVVLVAPLAHSNAQAPWVASVAGILGACATLAKSVDLVFKNHETWLRNNDSYGKLRSEQFLFEERAGTYKTAEFEERISMYADRIEAVIGGSTTSWSGAENARQGVVS